MHFFIISLVACKCMIFSLPKKIKLLSFTHHGCQVYVQNQPNHGFPLHQKYKGEITLTSELKKQPATTV